MRTPHTEPYKGDAEDHCSSARAVGIAVLVMFFALVVGAGIGSYQFYKYRQAQIHDVRSR